MEIPWVIENSTKAKHQLLENYIGRWMAILFNQQKNLGREQKLLYFDGFSGPGVYWEDNSKKSTCMGSPLIVGHMANKFIDEDSNKQLIIFCTDKNEVCVEWLNEELKRANRHKQSWNAYYAEFDNAINHLFDHMEEEGFTVVPTFYFVDPFGYAGFPMATLARILRYERTEIFINFMVYDVVRFCTDTRVEGTMESLFGCDDFKRVVEYDTPEERQTFLKNLYCVQLTKAAGAEFVMPFRINTPGQKGRPRYYMIHASKHYKALKEMKDAMARVSDSPYGFEAIGIASRQMNLFEEPDKVDLRNRIKAYCREMGQLFYEEVEKWAYVETNGFSKTIKKALLDLEGEHVDIERKQGQRKTTVTNGAMIIYRGTKNGADND